MLISPVIELLFLVTSGFLIFYFGLNRIRSEMMGRWYIFVPVMVTGTVFSLVLSFTVSFCVVVIVMAAPFLGIFSLVSKLVYLAKGSKEKPNFYPKYLK